MHSVDTMTRCTSLCLVLSFIFAQASGYFIITEPTFDTRWTVGEPASMSWRKGIEDGISVFDVELARLGRDGLTLIAKDVPASQSSLNVLLEDVPAGDDYFLFFVNSTHGAMHASSPRFSILDSSSASSDNSGQQPSAVSGVQTVTVSGAPNPTRQFAATLAAFKNGASASGFASQAFQFGTLVMSCFIGFAGTLW